MKTDYPNVSIERTRHGKPRARLKKKGYARVLFKTLPGDPDFAAEYQRALATAEIKATSPQPIEPGTVDALLVRYYKSADFANRGGEADRKRRRSLCEQFRKDYGRHQVSDFTFAHIETILMKLIPKRKDPATGRTVGGQTAAYNMQKELQRLFTLALKLDWIHKNPVSLAEKVGTRKLEGYYTWTEADIAKYQAHHALGTNARLALEIILWTGQRRGNAFEFGPRHIVNGKVKFQAIKGGTEMWLPVATDLRAAIDAMPAIGLQAYLLSEWGTPYTVNSFGNKMRDWCDEAGLPKCTAHGLRKALGRRMAQVRLTDEQMMAVGGWRDAKQVRVYTAGVDQAELADGALAAIDSHYSVKLEGSSPAGDSNP